MLIVSAVIPTHRRPQLLAQAIASVVAQRTAPCELVIVDDADDADTRAVVGTAAKVAPFPVHYALNTEGGVCRSRNLGAGIAEGAWLAFLDDDDIWHEDFLCQLTGQLRMQPVDFALSGVLRHQQGFAPTSRAQPPGLTQSTILQHTASMTGSNAVICRQAFFGVGGFDPSITVFNDWDLLIRLVDAGRRYTVIEQPLVEWRDHPGTRIATPTCQRADGIERFLRRYRHRLSPGLRRDLSTTALGIRFRRTTSLAARAMLAAQLACAHGPAGVVRRGVKRLRPARLPSG